MMMMTTTTTTTATMMMMKKKMMKMMMMMMMIMMMMMMMMTGGWIRINSLWLNGDNYFLSLCTNVNTLHYPLCSKLNQQKNNTLKTTKN